MSVGYKREDKIDDCYFFLSSRDQGKNNNQYISFRVDGLVLKQGTYTLTKLGQGGSITADYTGYSTINPDFNSSNYYIEQGLTGELNITKLDEVSRIIAGTFWFDAVNNRGEKVEVREGRFDMPIE